VDGGEGKSKAVSASKKTEEDEKRGGDQPPVGGGIYTVAKLESVFGGGVTRGMQDKNDE